MARRRVDSESTPAAAAQTRRRPKRHDTGIACPHCGGAALASDRFCEACGSPLPGGGEADDSRDEHVEFDHDLIAGVSDRGLHHATNEDALSVAAVGRALIAVVSDGVSSARGSGPAAQAAADAACAVLAEAVSASSVDLRGAMVDAVAIAQDSVLAANAPDPGNPPSCTLAAAVVVDHEATIGWIGDSRVYWLGAASSACLTTDDSWASNQIEAGVDQRAAEADRRSHEINRWLGADAPDATPHVMVQTLPGAGRVITCTDGLWNYGSAPSELEAQLASIPPDAWPIDVARQLTSFALDAGGQDNITVAVAAVVGDAEEALDSQTSRTTRLRARRSGDGEER